MKTRWILGVAIATIALTGPASQAAGGKARIGDYGFDTTGMNTAIKPGDDFNAFANGAWIKRNTIPGDRPYWGVWDELDEQARTDVRRILEEQAASPTAKGRKIGDYYASFMDEKTIEAKGATPLKGQLARIAAVKSYPDLARAIGESVAEGDDMPIGVQIQTDLKNPDVYVAYLNQGGLGLPDRDYYLSKDPKMAEARAAYQAYEIKLLSLAGLAKTPAEAKTRAQKVFDFEHKLAEAQWSRVQLRDIPAQYNPVKRTDYAAKAPGLDWTAYFKATGVGGQAIIINSQPTAIAATAKLTHATPLEVWRDYLALRAIDAHARYLSKPFVDASFAFHSTALAGIPDQEPRWKRGVSATDGALGEAVGEIYVQRHFSAEAKAQAKELVANELAAMGRRIDGLTWMTPETKAKARAKLATFNPKIGYPDKWRDYSKLTIVRGEAYANALAADAFEYRRQIDKLGQPVDRGEWTMLPMTINAYYNPTFNEIVFPAAVLQPPFFDPNADPAVNYGGIGAIIGHEISHGFDDQGRLFDAKGALSDWWTKADADKFKTSADALVAQYGAYEPLPGLKLNGELTLGENIADTAGLVIAYEAYHAALGGKPAATIGGLTGDQRFFLGFAQDWRTSFRDTILRQLVTTDPHSPDPIRVTTVRNFDPWYQAFGVQAGDKMYLAPDKRVRMW